VAVALTCVRRQAGAIDEIPLTGETALRLATVEEGAAALAAQDDFATALSRFDLQCRMQTGDEVTVDAWRKSVVAQVREWDPKHSAVVAESAARLRARMEKLKLPLPKAVFVVRTTGKEEGNAAYTRGSAIMLPETVLAHQPEQFDRLLAHELFHVLSRNQPMLRAELYGLIGFQTCEPIALPASLADRKITNPDAPLVDSYLELPDGDKTYFGAPILYASAQEYDAKAGGSLFKYLTFRLMVIEKRDGKLQPVMKDEKAVVIDPKNVPAFFEKIGRNTNYIIHPDEILADNFVHLVMGAENLATPRIVERMGRVLGK
jgi:hypothetical protein